MNFKKAIFEEPTVFLMKKLWRFSQGEHHLILSYVAMFMVANLILLTPPLLFGAVMRDVQFRGVSKENFAYLALLLALIFSHTFFFWLVHGPARIIERMVAFRANLAYRRHLIGGVLSLGLTWHGEHDSGDTIDKVNKASEGLNEFAQNVFQVVQVLVRLLGTTAVLIWFSPWIGFTVFGLVIFTFFLIFQFDKRLLVQYSQLNLFSNKASASTFDALSNVTTVKILHIESPVLQGVIARFAASKALYRQNANLNEYKWFTGNMCFQAIAAIPMLGYLYYLVQSGKQIDAGSISTLFMILSDLVFAWFGFGSFYERLTQFKNRILNASSIEDAFSVKDASQRKLLTNWSQVELSNLNFAYDMGAERLHLDAVNTTFQRGERIAVIGESGSGKTTFLKVLHGMYPNAKAGLKLDDGVWLATNFADIDLKTMLVPQEPELFSSTVGENLTLGIDYSIESVMRAAHVAAFDKVIEGLPKGLDSVINEKGVNLSGGQKQRLALARAILFSTEKEIILLDESTSSVDSENETAIYRRIFDAFNEKTIIASIHKMNLLKLFDRIIMFNNGRIVDDGSFEELLARNAEFRDAWQQFVARG